MAFIEYEQLKKVYPNGRMEENVRQLKELDMFHCLLMGSADRTSAVTKRVSGLPKDFIKWLEVCDGGMLFDTSMLTTVSFDKELDLEFETYGDYFDAELRHGMDLHDDWFVFAVAVHSDLFFFDMGKKDGKVHQWDSEEHSIYKSWVSFEDWLTYQIEEAIELIADEEIMPLGVKMEADNNG